jgi:uncharacterized membrane protein YqgA involved in biofilm formation
MVGTFVNVTAIVAGSAIGLAFGKKLPEKYETSYFQVVGLYTLLWGIRMALDISSPLLVLFSLVLGGFAGVKMKLTEKADRFGDYLKTRMKSRNERFSEGLTTGFLLFCMGSMGVVGAIEEGFGGTSELLLAKSVLDFFSSLMLASGLGVGVLYSAIPLLLYQGGITLAVSLIGKNIPDAIVNEITVTGGFLLMGLSLSLLKIKKMEIINWLPALLLIGLFMWLKMIFNHMWV